MSLQKNQHAWFECMATGEELIRQAHTKFPMPGVLCFSIYHLPSFSDCRSWSVYRDSEKYSVKLVTWERVMDGYRFGDSSLSKPSPAPTIQEAVFPMDAGWVDDQLRELAIISNPPRSSPDIGLDGEFFGISIPDRFSCEWWCHGFESWTGGISWVHTCIEYFQRLEMIARRPKA